MGATLWHFLEDDEGEMVRIPAVRARRFLDGEAPLDTGGRTELRFVDVALVVERRVVLGLIGAWPVLRRARRDGIVDADHEADGMRSALAASDLLSFLREPEENLVRIEPHLARRHEETVHRWRPSSEQLQQILNTLHDLAARPPIAAVSADGRLVPL